MTKIMAIANQKGGVGKTTTAINIAANLVIKGKKVLAIDLDPQGNLTSGFGIDKENLENTVFDVITKQKTIEDCIKKPEDIDICILPANMELATAELELLSIDNREYVLKEALEKHSEYYDFVVIDCPPSLNMLTINALTTANSVIVPLQCEYFALEGLTQLMNTVSLIKERLNSKIFIEGIVFTMYDARTNLSLQVVENVKRNIDSSIFKSIIPRNVRLAEAPSHGKPISLYDEKSIGAKAYMDLVDIILGE